MFTNDFCLYITTNPHLQKFRPLSNTIVKIRFAWSTKIWLICFSMQNSSIGIRRVPSGALHQHSFKFSTTNNDFFKDNDPWLRTEWGAKKSPQKAPSSRNPLSKLHCPPRMPAAAGLLVQWAMNNSNGNKHPDDVLETIFGVRLGWAGTGSDEFICILPSFYFIFFFTSPAAKSDLEQTPSLFWRFVVFP